MHCIETNNSNTVNGKLATYSKSIKISDKIKPQAEIINDRDVADISYKKQNKSEKNLEIKDKVENKHQNLLNYQ